MNKFMKRLMSKKDGFTLVELIVVIAILAILAGIAVPAYSGYLNKAKEANDTQTISAINTAIQAATAVNDAEVDAVTYNDTNGITLTWEGNDADKAATDYAVYIEGNSTIMERYNTFKVEDGLIVGSYVKPEG